MRKVSIIVLLFCISTLTFSQDKSNLDQVFKNVNIGLGIGFGGLYPNDLNDFLGDYFDDALFTKGFPEIIMSLNGQLSAQYFVNEDIEVCAEFNVAWAPKYISGVTPDYYNLTKVSPGFVANYYFPSKSNKNKKLFVGTGINYNFLAFKFGNKFKTKGNTPGALVQIGMMSTLRSKPIKHSLSYHYAKKSKVESRYLNELSFSGINLSSCIYF